MIASLGMYDRAETAAANDALWSLIRAGLRAAGHAAPEALTRGEAAYWPAWQDPDLTFSQTCGYPYRLRLHPHVTLVGTPDYGLPGCPPGHYNSVFIARADDPRTSLAQFRTARFAFNEALSQSGWAGPQTHVHLILGFHFQPSLQTGGHRLSALAVVEDRADIAAVDALTWALMQTHDPFTAQLREIARTAPTPALPYIAGPPRARRPLCHRSICDCGPARAPCPNPAPARSGANRAQRLSGGAQSPRTGPDRALNLGISPNSGANPCRNAVANRPFLRPIWPSPPAAQGPRTPGRFPFGQRHPARDRNP